MSAALECHHGLHPRTCALCKGTPPPQPDRRITDRTIAGYTSTCRCSQLIVPGQLIARLEDDDDPDSPHWYHAECAEDRL